MRKTVKENEEISLKKLDKKGEIWIKTAKEFFDHFQEKRRNLPAGVHQNC